MPPAASVYFRRRPFLTPEVCPKWRMSYLPRDTGGDHVGGIVAIFLDCHPEAEAGMKQCLGYLAQLCPVRLA